MDRRILASTSLLPFDLIGRHGAREIAGGLQDDFVSAICFTHNLRQEHPLLEAVMGEFVAAVFSDKASADAANMALMKLHAQGTVIYGSGGCLNWRLGGVCGWSDCCCNRSGGRSAYRQVS